LLTPKLKAATSVIAHRSGCHGPELEAMSTVKRGDWMPELLDGIDGSIKDEKASNVGPAGIDIAYQRIGKGDSHTYVHTRDTSIF
jgi:hypothetical protein